MILIQNILNGIQISENVLYEKYKKIIRDFIVSKYSIYYDIDDDISEILIKIFLNLKNFDINKSKFKTWVLNVTKNHMIDKWRCKSTKLTTNTSSYTSTYSDDLIVNQNTTTNNAQIAFTSNGSCSTCNFENDNTISYISTQLSPIDYTLLDMKYIQGYNYDEIGKEFQITSNTVSNKINYIKTKLKKNIHEDIYD